MRPLKLRPKEWALLARLALAEGPLTREELAHLLFPEAEDPRRALRWHLSALRNKLPAGLREALQADAGMIGLDAATDVAAFRAGALQARDPPGSVADPSVLGLYRGDLCASLTVSASTAFDTWLYVEQEGLRRLLRQATLAHARRAAGCGQAGETITPLSRLVTVDPYCEEAHVRLVEAYEALGDRDAARSAYRIYQRVVRNELQAQPRPALADRYEGQASTGASLPRDELVLLDEVTVHIVEWVGDEPAILGIHGSAGSAYSLTGLGERLSPACRFVAMDLRGHGFSDKPPSGYDVGRHVEDVVALLDAIGMVRPVVLGFSLGGPVAAGVAAQRDVAGLVLLEGAIGSQEFLRQRGSDSVVPTEASLDLRFSGVDEYVRHWRAENPRYSDEAERWVERFARFELAPLADGTFRRRGLREALRDEFASVLEGDSLGTLSRVTCPVLIVRAGQPWLGEGPWLTAEALAAQLQACPSARVFEAPRSNHASLVRDPEPELIDAIRAFARDVSRGPLG